MDASGQKILRLNDRFNFTVRVDIHSVQKMLFNRFNFTNPTTTVDFLNSDQVPHNVYWPSIGGNKVLRHSLTII